MDVLREDARALLQLLQLADSALPIGTAAHSFGLETLITERWLEVDGLEAFLRAFLREAGVLECAFCLQAQRLSKACDVQVVTERAGQWIALNARLSAWKMARESREASAALGRRLLQLALNLELHPLLPVFLQEARVQGTATHQSAAFGLLGGLLTIDETAVSLAYLQQMVAGLVSACQRLLPLGQSRASAILWRLHEMLIETVEQAVTAVNANEYTSFTALVDLGSMLHPGLETRLFIS